MNLPEPRRIDIDLGPDAQLTPTGLVISGEISFADWENVGFVIGAIRNMTSWALGDWLLYGEGLYGERYAQGIEATGRAKVTLQEYARVSNKVPAQRRRPSLSFTHHQLVAAKDPAEQKRLLDLAERDRLSVEEMRGLTALPTRRTLAQIARDLADAAEPLTGGYARVPSDLLDELRDCLAPPKGGEA